MNKKTKAERNLLFCLGTLDSFKNSVFYEDSVNFMLLEKIIDSLTEVYNYVQYGK